MKKVALALLAMSISFSVLAADLFPFEEVNHKWNLSLLGGYNHKGKVGLAGWGLTVRGFHLTIGGTTSSHKHDMGVDTWKEKASFLFHAGYQIPIVRSFRVIPVVGMAGIGEVTTDGSDYEIDGTTVENKVSSDLKYKLDYGAHFVYNHRKLIVKVCATRYTVAGGIGLEF